VAEVSRWHEDEVDVAAEAWAFQWVQAFGKAPDRASRYIGPLGSTLGRVRELHDGASSNTTRDRHFPEVFMGSGLVVAIALKAMTESSRELVRFHYVVRWYEPTTWDRLKRPMKQQLVANRMGVSLAEYYHRRDTAKACIRTVLFLDTTSIASARLISVQPDKVGSVPS
jgi:hypothetical protein